MITMVSPRMTLKRFRSKLRAGRKFYQFRTSMTTSLAGLAKETSDAAAESSSQKEKDRCQSAFAMRMASNE
jgi:hypothetical protein